MVIMTANHIFLSLEEVEIEILFLFGNWTFTLEAHKTERWYSFWKGVSTKFPKKKIEERKSLKIQLQRFMVQTIDSSI